MLMSGVTKQNLAPKLDLYNPPTASMSAQSLIGSRVLFTLHFQLHLHPNPHQMSTLPETSLSLLSQSNSPTTPWNVTGIFLVFALLGGAFHYASPAHLTRVLVSSLADAERAYLTGVENGNGMLRVSADIDVAERLAVLQVKASTLLEIFLRNSLSPLSACYDMFNIRRSVRVLRCLAEVRRLKTIIDISHEAQLREIASESRCQCPVANHTTISLRRRDAPTRICA
ncbi:hypothetical protein MSAN_00677600 [Mycena sanguinolenta]|uniref:Uncharacterized protein n=1 Tax=Mycena sanguinolenta TaxID=230812 RepID=A0A8H6Z0L3_9AGAR|nr:hypothetical protein MSAN_00677600 [Mycena sanguinolenta]